MILEHVEAEAAIGRSGTLSSAWQLRHIVDESPLVDALRGLDIASPLPLEALDKLWSGSRGGVSNEGRSGRESWLSRSTVMRVDIGNLAIQWGSYGQG